MTMNISRENQLWCVRREMTVHLARTCKEGINTEINTLPIAQKLGPGLFI
jgi:hypothetical protein